MIFVQIWRLIAAALLAMLLARVDDYVERRHGSSTVGKAYRMYRRRGKGSSSS